MLKLKNVKVFEINENKFDEFIEDLILGLKEGWLSE
jgi:hypothetical protein